MNRLLASFLLGASVLCAADRVTDVPLSYHPIRVDGDGAILPWPSADLGESYDTVLAKVWDFWSHMGLDRSGVPYFMAHQVWEKNYPDRRGAGGDQYAMALSSLRLYYAYAGDELIKEEAKVIADQYLARSLSPRDCAWPDLPFPYNTLVYSGVFDGDMILGVGITQPDKAGSFGYELLQLYAMTDNRRYLDAARRIADTLAARIRPSNRDQSPWPFKVDVRTGETARLLDNTIDQTDTARFDKRKIVGLADYTTNYAPTLELFEGLLKRGVGDAASYRRAHDQALAWMREYPLKNNRWGPFFEDIPGWSDTQINAVTFAQYLMEHREAFPEWKSEVRGILEWVYSKLGDDEWKPYGVTVVREQTAYLVPGNSHTARQAAAELRYAELTGDTSRKVNAIRQLSWATYMVDHDGKNRYPRDDIWLSDGYGDYVRHYLRAMAAAPELAPASKDRVLRSSSPLVLSEYAGSMPHFGYPPKPKDFLARALVHYEASEKIGQELLRLRARPAQVTVDGREISEQADPAVEGFSWRALEAGGLLTVRHRSGREVAILSAPGR